MPQHITCCLWSFNLNRRSVRRFTGKTKHVKDTTSGCRSPNTRETSVGFGGLAQCLPLENCSFIFCTYSIHEMRESLSLSVGVFINSQTPQREPQTLSSICLEYMYVSDEIRWHWSFNICHMRAGDGASGGTGTVCFFRSPLRCVYARNVFELKIATNPICHSASSQHVCTTNRIFLGISNFIHAAKLMK